MSESYHNYPLISIGIPTYNRPITLHKLLSSVINQTYKNLEIIISDDCSLGCETELIVREFMKTDNRIKYFRQNKNTGSSRNANFVIEKASGKYFIWLNDDDWIDNNYIENCFTTLINNPDYILVCGKTKFYWEERFAYDGVIVNVMNTNQWDRLISFYMQELGSGNYPNFGIIKKDELIKVPIQNIIGYDTILFANIAFMGKIKTLENVCTHRNLGGESNSLENIALKLKQPTIQIKHPFISLWINIFKDIAWESEILKSSNKFKRVFQAVKLSIIMLINLSKYFARYKKRLISQSLKFHTRQELDFHAPQKNHSAKMKTLVQTKH